MMFCNFVVGKADGSRERAPDDKLHVPTVYFCVLLSIWWARRKGAFAHPTKSRRLLVARIEIVARRCRRGHVVGTRAVWPPPPPREALATALETARAAIDLRLRSGDEGRRAIDADIIRDYRLRLWLRLKLRLRTMLAMAGVFAGLMLVARLVRLALALVLALIVVARHERLRLHR